MSRSITLLLLCSMTIWGSAQNVGDQYTAGFNGQRTGLNANMGNLSVPVKLIRSVPLPSSVQNPTVFLPFEYAGQSVFSARPGQSMVVVGEIDISGEVRYFVFGVLDPGADPACTAPDDPNCVLTVFEMPFGMVAQDIVLLAGASTVMDASLEYAPSFAQDIVLLAGASTVKAVDISTMPDATLAWADGSLGDTNGRSPLVSGDLALYHGRSGVVAREADSGIVLWQNSTTTAPAPLAMKGERVYFLGEDGVVNALNSASGSTVWSSLPLGLEDGTSIIASEKYVFLSGAGAVGALDARDGSGPVWSDLAPGLASNPGIALAYDRLFVFQSDNAGDGSGVAEVRAYNPDCIPACSPASGELLWSVSEDSPGLDYAAIANNQIWYYNSGSGRVRVRDAFSGDLLWSIERPGLRGLTLADGLVFMLTPTASTTSSASARQSGSNWQVEVHRPSDQLFFAQMANGLGQSTLVALSNVSNQEISGTIRFFDINGDPLPLPVEGILGDSAAIPFSIPALGSGKIQTQGGDDLQRGWIRVDPDCQDRCPGLRGSSLFQFTDAGAILFEAGVRQASPTGQGVVAVELREAPRPDGGTQLLSTGVAIANPSSESATITLTLKDSDGSDVAQLVVASFEPGAQLAQFVEELFPTEVGNDFQGSLLIQSDIPLIITALRTGGGFQLSSFEVGQAR